MFRAVLILLFFVIVVFAVTSATTAVKMALVPAKLPSQRDTMPDTVRRIAYVALIVLMFGVVSGWLGAS